MQSVHEVLEQIKKESPDLYDALEKVIINARVSLAVIKTEKPLTDTQGDGTDTSVGSHPHP